MSERSKFKLGGRFERLVLLQELPPYRSHRRFLCKCDCGNESIVMSYNLGNGHTRSCGCLRKYSAGYDNNGNKTKLYHTWDAMKQRCANNRNCRYRYYGGRGIAVCDEWLEFESFRNWAMANGYQDGLTIERINNDGNYEPKNCTWIPKGEQWRNRRDRETESGIRGVSWDKRRARWRARVSFQGRERYHHSFLDFEAASLAVSKARSEIHGI